MCLHSIRNREMAVRRLHYIFLPAGMYFKARDLCSELSIGVTAGVRIQEIQENHRQSRHLLRIHQRHGQSLLFPP